MAEFNETTNTIDNIVSTQLSSVLNWMNIPGNLVKASESSSGFVWGYNSLNQLYMCRSPCNGNWKQIDLTSMNVAQIYDIATDITNVYLLVNNLLETQLLISPVSLGEWQAIKIPIQATQIFSTHTYIWAQNYLTKTKCAKPCMNGNWISSEDTKVQITGCDDSTLYGQVTITGEPVKTDEHMRTGWSPISGLQKFDKPISTGIDGLYIAKNGGGISKFDGKTEIPIELNGYRPSKLTLEPITKHMWMTATTSDNKGNVFTRLENSDYSTIQNVVVPLDKKRDEIVTDIGKDYSRQTDVMTLNKQLNTIVSFFQKLFKIDKNSLKNGQNQVSEIQDKIRNTQSQLDQINVIQPLIIKFIILLLVILFVYLIGTSFIGSYIHIVSFLTLIGGTIYIIFN